MKNPDSQPSVAEPVTERAYRSPAGIAGGVLLLVMAVWLGSDAVINGDARTRWLAVGALLFLVPLVVAFTLRPAVYADENRLRVRNPFRVITLPWASVSGVRAHYSSEVFTEGGDKYQLWAIPVSIRARKKASRRPSGRKSIGVFGPVAEEPGVRKAPGDQSLDEIRALAEERADKPASQGAPSVRWAWEIVVPVVVGAVLVAVVLVVG
ncbi:PH domain-containing protein [Streptomyces sp. NPDC058067]|uniref:PH domain-containing protein n=1 Tax=Streptomyces sp. NPDC058067 TaxID=3346324 RepID=UPI0036E1115F